MFSTSIPVQGARPAKLRFGSSNPAPVQRPVRFGEEAPKAVGDGKIKSQIKKRPWHYAAWVVSIPGLALFYSGCTDLNKLSRRDGYVHAESEIVQKHEEFKDQYVGIRDASGLSEAEGAKAQRNEFIELMEFMALEFQSSLPEHPAALDSTVFQTLTDTLQNPQTVKKADDLAKRMTDAANLQEFKGIFTEFVEEILAPSITREQQDYLLSKTEQFYQEVQSIKEQKAKAIALYALGFILGAIGFSFTRRDLRKQWESRTKTESSDVLLTVPNEFRDEQRANELAKKMMVASNPCEFKKAYVPFVSEMSAPALTPKQSSRILENYEVILVHNQLKALMAGPYSIKPADAHFWIVTAMAHVNPLA